MIPPRSHSPPRDTFGPHGGLDEILPSWPSERYATGVLYAPQMPRPQSFRDVDATSPDDRDAPPAPHHAAPAARLPSVMGLTFSLEGDAPALRVTAAAAAYAPMRAANGGRIGARRPLAVAPPAPLDVREGLHLVASVGHARWWLHGVRAGSRWEVTVTLENASRPGASRVEAEALHLFQVGFEVAATGDARITPLTAPAYAFDDDALVFDLLDRDATPWALGRSCDAAWRFVDGRCLVSTARHERGAEPAAPDHDGATVQGPGVDDALDVATLARADDADALAATLEPIPRAYERWQEQVAGRIEAQAASGRLNPSRTAVARHNLVAAGHTAARIRAGIAALANATDDTARRAFRLSQRALLVARRGAPETSRWEAWQLAFMLLVIGDLASVDASRDAVMDVLSVPSREGRWATHLALSTFAVLLHRLRAESDAARSVSVVLRPAAAHLPWHRAAAIWRVMRACEALRREALRRGDASLGHAPFSVAVCAGEGASFAAVRGPWGDTAGLSEGAACPDVLVGDAAACARVLAETACMASRGAGKAPALLVQDEMDVLQGPRGAEAGAYEAVVDLFLTRGGVRPKAIGSVAATRGLQALTRTVFDRPGARFPPPVLDANDTGFPTPRKPSEGASPGPWRRTVAGVEPFSARARDRALRPAMEALARAAQALDPRRRSLDATWRERCDRWVDALLDRVDRIAPDERFHTSRAVEAMLDAWQRRGSVGGEPPQMYPERLWSLVIDGVARSALDIPPFSPDPSYRFGTYWSMIRDASPAQRRVLVQVASEMLKEPFDVLLRVVEEWAETQASDPKDEDVRVAEYRQFVRALREPIEKPEFDTRPEPVPAEFGTLFEGVALARRLREVRAQVAFTRISPPGGMFRAGAEVPYNLSRARLPWLPAIELRGEGIFLAFHPDAVAAWEDESANPALRAHFDRFAARFRREALAEARTEAERAEVSARVDGWRPYGARFVMLHSFAHALMRQLSLACGYGSSALRERVYVGDAPARQMGVLLHTDSPDSEGTLGGLVRQGRRERLRDTLVALLHDAAWCSSDPVCITGTMTLSTPRNGAACHACLLAPETSCEHFNTLLDRALLVGTPDAPRVGFFGDWLRENR